MVGFDACWKPFGARDMAKFSAPLLLCKRLESMFDLTHLLF